MKRDAYLTAALKTCTQDRQNVHGDPEDSFTAIADHWTIYLTHTLGVEVILEPEHVAMMMVLLKISRSELNAYHADNYIDGAGYFAIAGELASRHKDRVAEFKAEAMAA